jgi:superfamily II DNA/RNA helicase
MTFSDLGLSPALLTILEKEGFETPTPIQEQAIPLILEGSDVIGVAHTGTGKTLAFALPLMDRLSANEGMALILVPTRELALQLDKAFRRVALPKMKPSLLLSGVPIERQVESLKTRPRIVIATPGRLNEHLDAKTFRLDSIVTVVLDEADRMLDSGFAPQVERILDRSPKTRQTLMFSATMSRSVSRLLERYSPAATRITIADDLHDMSLIDQSCYKIGSTRRVALLTKLLHEHKGHALVFLATKRATQALYTALKETPLDVAGLHGDRTAAGRKEAVDGFRKGSYQVLLATDVAARGIDLPQVSLVINYDVPRDTETYVHRMGRTGRAGRKGRAVTFVTPEQSKGFKRIEEDLLIHIPVIEKS